MTRLSRAICTMLVSATALAAVLPASAQSGPNAPTGPVETQY